MNHCIDARGIDTRGPMVGLMVALPVSLAIWSVFGLVAVIVG